MSLPNLLAPPTFGVVLLGSLCDNNASQTLIIEAYISLQNHAYGTSFLLNCLFYKRYAVHNALRRTD